MGVDGMLVLQWDATVLLDASQLLYIHKMSINFPNRLLGDRP